MSTIDYIKNFIRDKDVASITPSSPFLVKRVCQKVDFSEPRVIVEYGPGTGVFTEYLLERLKPGSKLILIEKNEGFVEILRDTLGQDPRVMVYEEAAENVADVLRDAGETEADYVLSGIPFSFLTDAVRTELIEQTREILGPDGRFLVYQNYNHMEKPLRQHFDHVTKEYELFNIPPMYAYEAMMT